MKRLADLTIEDLTAAPVWRYEGGTCADAVVVPAPKNSLSQEDEDVFLAATEFTLPDSSRHLGYCFPVDDSGIDYLQPVIVTRNGQIRFWFDGPIPQEVLSAQWNALGKQLEEVFPVRFRCLVQVDGRAVTGVIPNIESSADTTRTWEGEPIPDAPESSEPIPERSRRASRSVPGTRPTPARARSVSTGAAQKRSAPRHDVEMLVEFEQGASRGIGVTGDVSRGGMFVRAARIPSVGPLLSLTVSLPDGRKLLLKGRVVRTAGPGLSASVPRSGFGLRLADQPAEFEEFLKRFLDHSK